MTRRLIEDLPDRTEWFVGYDDDTDTAIVETEFKHVREIIDWNKAVQGKDAGKTKDDDNPGQWHVARIPKYVLEKWIKENDWPYERNGPMAVFNEESGIALMAKLDDIENRDLRVNTGVIGARKKML